VPQELPRHRPPLSGELYRPLSLGHLLHAVPLQDLILLEHVQLQLHFDSLARLRHLH
jgi:hypothetical protein